MEAWTFTLSTLAENTMTMYVLAIPLRSLHALT
jgi:hypothetical protein